MWSSEVTNMIIVGIGETLYMTLVSTLLGYVLGLPMGIVLTVTDRDGIHPNAVVYKILDFIANLVRSIPFIILLVVLIPFTRLLVGKSYGPTAMIVSLVIAAAPYIARMVESSLKEVDAGVIEAARSMGASDFTIEGNVGRSKNFPDRGSNHQLGNHLRLFRYGRNRWRWWTWCHCNPLRIYQMADRYHDCNGVIIDHFIPDLPDRRNEISGSV